MLKTFLLNTSDLDLNAVKKTLEELGFQVTIFASTEALAETLQVQDSPDLFIVAESVGADSAIEYLGNFHELPSTTKLGVIYRNLDEARRTQALDQGLDVVVASSMNPEQIYEQLAAHWSNLVKPVQKRSDPRPTLDAPESMASRSTLSDSSLEFDYSGLLQDALPAFLQETAQILDQFERIVNRNSNEFQGMDDIHELFREVHTLKGNSAVYPQAALMTELAQPLEGLLGRIRDGKCQWTETILDRLDQAYDLLREIFDGITQDQKPSEDLKLRVKRTALKLNA